MREQDVPVLANAWYELLSEYKDRRPEFGEQLLGIIGQYVCTYLDHLCFEHGQDQQRNSNL